MKKINLQPGGFPMTTKTFKHLTEMTEQVAAVVAKMAGNNNVIISGVQEVNGVITNGWIVVDGELYPFVGGPANTYVRISQNVEQVQYLVDNDNNGIGDFVDAYINRFATFSSVAQGNIPFEDFVRYEDINTNVIKSGVIEINTSTLTGSVISGDFTSVQIIAINGYSINFIYQYYAIHFEEVHQDYDVIINPVGALGYTSSGQYYFRKVYTALIQKQSDKLRLSLKSIDGSILSASTPRIRFEITLINKY